MSRTIEDIFTNFTPVGKQPLRLDPQVSRDSPSLTVAGLKAERDELERSSDHDSNSHPLA
jgi:hypothetical protein